MLAQPGQVFPPSAPHNPSPLPWPPQANQAGVAPQHSTVPGGTAVPIAQPTHNPRPQPQQGPGFNTQQGPFPQFATANRAEFQAAAPLQAPASAPQINPLHLQPNTGGQLVLHQGHPPTQPQPQPPPQTQQPQQQIQQPQQTSQLGPPTGNVNQSVAAVVSSPAPEPIPSPMIATPSPGVHGKRTTQTTTTHTSLMPVIEGYDAAVEVSTREQIEAMLAQIQTKKRNLVQHDSMCEARDAEFLRLQKQLADVKRQSEVDMEKLQREINDKMASLDRLSRKHHRSEDYLKELVGQREGERFKERDASNNMKSELQGLEEDVDKLRHVELQILHNKMRHLTTVHHQISEERNLLEMERRRLSDMQQVDNQLIDKHCRLEHEELKLQTQWAELNDQMDRLETVRLSHALDGGSLASPRSEMVSTTGGPSSVLTPVPRRRSSLVTTTTTKSAGRPTIIKKSKKQSRALTPEGSELVVAPSHQKKVIQMHTSPQHASKVHYKPFRVPDEDEWDSPTSMQMGMNELMMGTMLPPTGPPKGTPSRGTVPRHKTVKISRHYTSPGARSPTMSKHAHIHDPRTDAMREEISSPLTSGSVMSGSCDKGPLLQEWLDDVPHSAYSQHQIEMRQSNSRRTSSGKKIIKQKRHGNHSRSHNHTHSQHHNYGHNHGGHHGHNAWYGSPPPSPTPHASPSWLSPPASPQQPVHLRLGKEEMEMLMGGSKGRDTYDSSHYMEVQRHYEQYGNYANDPVLRLPSSPKLYDMYMPGSPMVAPPPHHHYYQQHPMLYTPPRGYGNSQHHHVLSPTMAYGDETNADNESTDAPETPITQTARRKSKSGKVVRTLAI